MPDYLETTVDKFIFKVATDRTYTPEGIWVLEEEGGNRVRLGISDYQQQLNGDVAFVHLKPVGTACAKATSSPRLRQSRRPPASLRPSPVRSWRSTAALIFPRKWSTKILMARVAGGDRSYELGGGSCETCWMQTPIWRRCASQAEKELKQ